MRSLLLLAFFAGGVHAQPDPRVDALEKELAQLKARLETLEAEAKDRNDRDAAARVRRTPGLSAVALYEKAQAMEEGGNKYDVVQLYVHAARSGSGKAAKRLGEIYGMGLLGVKKDFAESLKWYNAARILGEDVPMARSR